MPGKLSPEIEDEICALWVDAKMPAQLIATEVLVSTPTVYKVLRERGLVAAGGPKSKLDWVAILHDYDNDYREGRMTMNELLAKYQISMNQLAHARRAAAVPAKQATEKEWIKTRTETAVAMYKEGTRVFDIIAELGLDLPRLYALLRKEGVPLRTKVRGDAAIKAFELREKVRNVQIQALAAKDAETTGGVKDPPKAEAASDVQSPDVLDAQESKGE